MFQGALEPPPGQPSLVLQVPSESNVMVADASDCQKPCGRAAASCTATF